MRLNIFKTLAIKLFKKYAIKYLESEKENIVKYINEKVDVPGLTEEQEKEHFEALYQLNLDIIKDLVK